MAKTSSGSGARWRVAHVINAMEVGGAQRQLLNLFESVDRERFDFRLICLNELGNYGERLRAEGFVCEALYKGRGFDAVMFRRLVGLLRAWRPDIVHCHVFTSNLWGRLAALAAGVRLRFTHEQSTLTLDARGRVWIERLLLPATTRVLCVSEDIRRRMREEAGAPAAKLGLLPNAMDVAGVERAAREGPDPDLPGAPGRRVGVVGRLEYRKDHLTLVRAAARVRERLGDVHFLLAGEGPDRPKLEAEIKRLGLHDCFHLLGERDDVHRLLPCFDIYVLCSITEGLSLSILEAMAATRPVVATRVGGNPELLDEGRAGRLCPASDPAALAEAIVDLLERPGEAARLARAGRERVGRVYDLDPVARRLEAYYEEVLGG